MKPQRLDGLALPMWSTLMAALVATGPAHAAERTDQVEGLSRQLQWVAPAASDATRAEVKAGEPKAAAKPDARRTAASSDKPLLTEPKTDVPPASLLGGPVQLQDAPAPDDLWMRLRHGFKMPDLETQPVQDKVDWYIARPDYVQRMTERAGRYLFFVVEEIERRNMPAELALLPFIESAFNPNALSVAKASGMWQFMPLTGKDYSLKQSIFKDDRRDVQQSTRAALDYLQRLHTMFGDWHLALAAYNWGEGNVQKAIKRNQAKGLPTDYASLDMPLETRQYVPKLQAVKNIIASPEWHGLALPPLANHPYFASVPIQRDIDVELAAKLAKVRLEDFKALNPQMNKPVILAAGTPHILLPYDNAQTFADNLAQHQGKLASWTAWVAPRNMRPTDVARQVGASENELRSMNQIPPRMLVKAGSTLLVPRSEQKADQDVSEHVASTATLSFAPDAPALRKSSIKVGKKDTLASLAARYKTTPDQLAQWNKMSSQGKLKAGQSLTVYVPVKGKAVAAKGSQRPAAHPGAKASGKASSKPSARPAPKRKR